MQNGTFARVIAASAVSLAIIGMYGCGGSDGVATTSSTAAAPAPDPTISGVVASGAPIANASITVTCADGTTKTGTADANGAYSINVKGCAAPLVITATGQVGEAQKTLVSIHATTVSDATTVNVTPITNAIAATLASDGNPLTLASNIANEKANITETAVKDRKDALAAALAPVLQQAGVTGAFDLVNTKFTADSTLFDKVLDNVKVVVTPSGVTITNVGGAKVDDMGDQSGKTVAGDLSTATIAISRSTNFKAGLTKLPAGLEDGSIADSFRDAMNACFAKPAAQRGTYASSSCNIPTFAADYLHNGRNGSQEFNRFLISSKYDGATFSKPEVIRYFSTAANDTRALIRLGLKRTDGVGEWLDTVAEKSTATGGVVKIRGNQRLYRMFVNGFVTRRVQVSARGTAQPKSTYYYTGINVYFGYKEGGAGTSTDPNVAVAYVRVTGPGLPTGGLFLNPNLSGCDSYFAITTSSTATPVSCTSLFKMQSRAATAGDTDNVAGNFGVATFPDYASPTKLSDATLSGIQSFSAYKFEIFKKNNTSGTADIVYVERLRSRPVALGTVAAGGEVDKFGWNTALDQSTIDAIDPNATGKTFTGGSSFTVKWANVPNTPPIYSLQVQTRPSGVLFQDDAGVGFAQTTVSLTNSGVAWPDMSKTTGPGNFNLVQLRSRNADDLQFFMDWRY